MHSSGERDTVSNHVWAIRSHWANVGSLHLGAPTTVYYLEASYSASSIISKSNLISENAIPKPSVR